MIIKKAKKVEKKNKLLLAIRFSCYLFVISFALLVLDNKLFVKNNYERFSERVSSIFIGKHEHAVTNMQQLSSFIAGAFRGTFSNYSPEKVNLSLQHSKILKTYNDSINGLPREYVGGNFEIISSDQPRTYKAKLRSKGDRALHWEDVNSMSFRVDLKGEDRFLGLEEFSIQKPIIRNYIWEFLIAEIANQQNLLTLKMQPIQFYVNGDNRGIYILEEVPSKISIERQQRKDGPIFGMDEDISSGIDSKLDPYEFKRWERIPMYIYAKELLYSEFSKVRLGKNFSDEVFDFDEWSKYFALMDVFGSFHGALPKSVKFYYNPVLGKFQPLLFDAHKGAGRFNQFSMVDFLLEDDPRRCEYLCEHKAFYIGFLQNKAFLEKYIFYLKKFSSEQFIRDIFNSYEEELQHINDKFYSNFSPADAIFQRSFLPYFFNFSLILDRAIFLKNKISLLEDMQPTINEQSLNTDRSNDKYKIKLNRDIKVVELNNYNLQGNRWEINEPTVVIFTGDTVLKGISRSQQLIISGPAMFVQLEGAITIDDVHFKSLEVFNIENRNWSSVLNIIDSKVIIGNVVISDNKGEDSVNLISSKFDIGRIEIYGSSSDAFDSDFSDGSINQLICKNIGNDCIDVSESNINVNKILVEETLDKAVSAGENSNLLIEDIVIKNTSIGLVSKDGSNLRVNNVDFFNTELDVAAFRKKPNYESPSITIGQSSFSVQPYGLVTEDSATYLPNEFKIEILTSNEIENLMYGAVYGKATEK